MPSFDSEIDLSGLICPQPLLATKQSLKKLSSGKILKVICTDPSSVIYFKVLAETSEHQLVNYFQRQNKLFFL